MSALARILGVAVISFAVLAQGVRAAEAAPKTVTVKGKIACAMCVLKLKEYKTCTNVLVTSEGGKEVVYGLAANDVTKAYDMAACEKAIPVKVTGTVTEAGGKRTLEAKSIEKT